MTRLAKFTVEGYRSFGNAVTIDFCAVHDYKFSKECVSDGVITKVGIYGPNGCGKSNLGFALMNIVSHLTDKESGILKNRPGIFLNVDGNVHEAVFLYTFKIDDDFYTLEYHKKDEESISREIFSVNEAILYDYDYSKQVFAVKEMANLVSDNLNFAYLGDKMSVFRYIANNSVQEEGSPIKAIMDFVSHMLWFRSVGGNSYIGLDTGVVNLDEWIVGNGHVADFTDFIKDVCNIDIGLSTVEGIDGKPLLVEKHDNGLLLFRNVSSSGTSAAELFYFWMKRFSEVSFLFIDEFDAFYHFALAIRIVEKLMEYPEMQAVFTTHNTALLGNSILRPDCYLIFGNKVLRSYIDMAGDREIREGHNLEKIYRSGGLDG